MEERLALLLTVGGACQALPPVGGVCKVLPRPLGIRPLPPEDVYPTLLEEAPAVATRVAGRFWSQILV